MADAAYYLANAEGIKAKARARYYANRDRYLAVQQKYRAAHPNKHRDYYAQNRDRLLKEARKYNEERGRNLRMIRRFGINLEQYQQMLAVQEGRCAVRGCTSTDKTLHVDHDHATGKVRGLLCRKCNCGIGLFNESTDALNGAIEYLQRHG